MKKVIFIILGVGASLLFIGYIILVLFLSSLPDDISPVDDTALRRLIENIPSNINAFMEYSSACESLYYPEETDEIDRILNGEEWNENFVSSLLVSNSQCFACVENGNAKARCLTPRVKSYDTLMPYIANWRKIARLFVLKAKYATRKDQPDEAVDAVSSFLRFTSLSERDAGSLLQYLVALAMREMALTTTRYIIRSDILNTNQLSKLHGVLCKNQPSLHGLTLAWKTEYELFASLIDSLAEGEITLNLESGMMNWFLQKSAKYFFHPNRTKRDISIFYTELIDQVTNSYAEMQLTDVEEFVMTKKQAIDTANGLQKFRVPNPIGPILYALLLPSTRGVIKKKCNSQLSYRATILIAALHIYRKSTGHYPTTLDDLVPDIIPKMLLDPYDGKPIRYSSSNDVVYSVGEDLLDSGGSDKSPSHKNSQNKSQRKWQTEDIVFKIQ